MKEYYITANSFAAREKWDTSNAWWNGIDPVDALTAFVKEYKHPMGLYAANIYTDANAESKGEKPLAEWRSNASLGITQNPKDGKIISEKRVVKIEAHESRSVQLEFHVEVVDPIGDWQVLNNFIAELDRGVWQEDIHGWRVNPAHITMVRLLEE